MTFKKNILKSFDDRQGEDLIEAVHDIQITYGLSDKEIYDYYSYWQNER